MQYQTYTHPGQPQMQVEVILASRHAYMPDEKPLYTIRLRYPRIIHGEIMTHRVFSRNARSSRAVPVRTMLLECTSMPFIPWHWGANQKGMQASEECNAPIEIGLETAETGIGFIDEPIMLSREDAWLTARDSAVEVASAFMDAGYHKQNVNRLLEPFAWIDVLITANDWDNFLWLRDHEAAEPHLIDLACLVKQAIDEAQVQELHPGHWHQPYITDDDREATRYMGVDEAWEWLNKISSARCARISYKPFDGDASYEKELARYDMLVSSDRVHASPTEHQATPDTQSLIQRLLVEPVGDSETLMSCDEEWNSPELHGNLTGWIQFRKTIPGEHHSDSAMQERS